MSTEIQKRFLMTLERSQHSLLNGS